MSSYRISKRFKFDAAHRLDGLPDGHQCGRVHGHTYTVQVVVGAKELTAEGWILDFGEMSVIKRYIDTYFDHRFLNEVVEFQTTSENLAKHFYEMAETLLNLPRNGTTVWFVRVSETDATWAQYER